MLKRTGERADGLAVGGAPAEYVSPAEYGPRPLHADPGLPDRIFRGVARGGGALVLAVMLLVGGFLLYRAWQALERSGWSFLTTEAWEPDAGRFGIAAVIVGTVLIALVAIVVAIPLAVGGALYISEYAPLRIRRTLISVVDLMAAVPSVVYGLWGLFFFEGAVLPTARWLATYLGWFPPFRVVGIDPRDPLATETVYTSSTLIAGIVVALMVAPIICSVMREVFAQAPAGEREGAYALGATRWGMIHSVVLPFGKGGMIGGTMLGLGRALGETIAVYLIISPVFQVQWHVLQSGTSSVSSLIALRYGEASPFGMSALMAAGLALFVMTLIVNFAASSIVARSRSGAASDA
ncbi:phosphate ABC transporter permease subunit PstC [Streptomyces sp. NPDC059255]|uniref:phosphate ABC transporter permease subunit PstC n=1 Tax=Streptomyces sp. NPDC059255 TaxID=3346793 RepID=UPI003698312F